LKKIKQILSTIELTGGIAWCAGAVIQIDALFTTPPYLESWFGKANHSFNVTIFKLKHVEHSMVRDNVTLFVEHSPKDFKKWHSH
jgi:hypothetical protein